jgi:threonylcarbamoyladenosine tRNA methylthiotransferase MtaB
MRFAIATLGCKINQYDSQLLREGLLLAGHTEQPFSEPGADWYIVNTCTVTHRSDADARKLIRRSLREGGTVVVTGCQAEVYAQEIRAISDQILVVPPRHIHEVLDLDLPPFISDFRGHSRAFVKVQQGCDMFCAYCIVPHARGKPWSRKAGEVIAEIEALHRKGFREIVLTGINIGLYEGGLARLVQEVIARTSMERIRISSLEPWTVEDALLEIMEREPRMCRHLHLPLQHGSDRILRAMGRPYDSGFYRSLLHRIRSGIGNMAVGSDVVVGFPGEDDAAFDENYRFIADAPVSYLHVFPFSPRPGTPAFLMGPRVNESVARERAERLRELSREKRAAFSRSQVGSDQEILVTRVMPGVSCGVTSNYLTVQVPYRASPGDLVQVRITGMEGTVVRGERNG